MLKLAALAGLALTLGACVYTPTPGPSVAPVAGGYTLNDNGYQAYYTTKTYPIADCASTSTYRCEDRLAYDDEFCADWPESARCGDSAVTSEPSKEISPIPPGGRGWFWF
jgi:hypothetical protein